MGYVLVTIFIVVVALLAMDRLLPRQSYRFEDEKRKRKRDGGR